MTTEEVKKYNHKSFIGKFFNLFIGTSNLIEFYISEISPSYEYLKINNTWYNRENIKVVEGLDSNG